MASSSDGSTGRAAPRRRRAAWVVLIVLGAPAVQGCDAPRAPAAVPSLLVVVIDTLRRDHLSAYGYARDTSPHLDRLAGEGVRFATAYAPTATTAPSHASLFTSLPPYVHGVTRNGVELEPSHRTLAEVLRAAGYETAAVVSSFVLDRRFGLAQGFDHYEDDFDAATSSFAVEEFAGAAVPEGFDRRAAQTSERAIRWLESGRGAKEPFLLFVHYFDPHDPYSPPAEVRARYAPRPHELAREELAVALYDAEIRYTDAEVGRLLGALERLGLAERTVVAVTSDHGEGLWDHGHLYHDVHLYEEAVGVPLLVRWPGRIPAGRVIEAPVDLLDLAPTLLELAGLAPGALPGRGRSLAPALLGGAPLDPEHPVFLQRRSFRVTEVVGIPVTGPQIGVRVGPWKYLEAAEQGRELFHLGDDPAERRDLHEREPERARALSERIAAWRKTQPPPTEPRRLSPENRARLEALGYRE